MTPRSGGKAAGSFALSLSRIIGPNRETLPAFLRHRLITLTR
jgi:hypothetical protein